MSKKKSPLLTPDQLKQVALEFPDFLRNPQSYKQRGLEVASKILGLDLSEVLGEGGGVSGYSSLSQTTREVAGIVLKKTKLRRQVPPNLKKLADLAGNLLDSVLD